MSSNSWSYCNYPTNFMLTNTSVTFAGWHTWGKGIKMERTSLWCSSHVDELCKYTYWINSSYWEHWSQWCTHLHFWHISIFIPPKIGNHILYPYNESSLSIYWLWVFLNLIICWSCGYKILDLFMIYIYIFAFTSKWGCTTIHVLNIHLFFIIYEFLFISLAYFSVVGWSYEIFKN